jgi:hypothetical protein
MRARARTHQGLQLPLDAAAARRRPDVVIVPALGCKTPEALDAALGRRDVADAAAALREWGARRRAPERRLHRHLRARRDRPARRAPHDHDVVAGATVPRAQPGAACASCARS